MGKDGRGGRRARLPVAPLPRADRPDQAGDLAMAKARRARVTAAQWVPTKEDGRAIRSGDADCHRPRLAARSTSTSGTTFLRTSARISRGTVVLDGLGVTAGTRSYMLTKLTLSLGPERGVGAAFQRVRPRGGPGARPPPAAPTRSSKIRRGSVASGPRSGLSRVAGASGFFTRGTSNSKACWLWAVEAVEGTALR